MSPKEKKQRQKNMKRLENDLHEIVRTGREALKKSKQLQAAMLEGLDTSLEREALDIVVRTFKDVSAPTTAAGKVLLSANGGSFDVGNDDDEPVVLPTDPVVAQVKMGMAHSFQTTLDCANKVALRKDN